MWPMSLEKPILTEIAGLWRKKTKDRKRIRENIICQMNEKDIEDEP
jgi:hypothetical protein